MSQSVMTVAKSEAVGEAGMVAAKHPLAAEAGLAVLRRGGNAVDAAVVMTFAMGVLEPGGNGIGGGGLMVLYQARTGRTAVVDYAMDAPLAAAPDAYELTAAPSGNLFGWQGVKDDANAVGFRAASVPGSVRGLALALARFGTIPLAEALAPAIRFAADGVEVGWRTTLWIAAEQAVIARYPATAAVLMPRGVPPRPTDGIAGGDRLVQSDLAATLERIAADGPDAFYTGPIARAIVEAMREHGGLIAAEDLARYRPTVFDEALATEYRGYQVVGPPGACGAVTVLEALNILEGFELGARPADAVENVHAHAEAYRIAFADRFHYVADPKQVAVPWAGLLSKAYAKARRRGIDPARAAAAVEAGDPWAYDAAAPAAALAPGGSEGNRVTSTTHVCAVDRERNLVTVTETQCTSSGAIVPGTGILLNNAMLWFDPRPGRANSIAPGKRGLNNMTPLLVLRDGRPVLAVGASGGRRILNALTQILCHVLDYGMGVQDAIGAPRIDCSLAEVLVDSRFPTAVPAGLAALGHRLRVVQEGSYPHIFSTPYGILIDERSGRLHGGVDPFSTAVAMGY